MPVANDNASAFRSAASLLVTTPTPPFGKSIYDFLKQFLREIRRIICKFKASSQNLGHTTTGALAGLVAWLIEYFGMSSHAAAAVAVAILIAVASAFKGAFCKMTEEEAKKRLTRTTRPQRKRKKGKDD